MTKSTLSPTNNAAKEKCTPRRLFNPISSGLDVRPKQENDKNFKSRSETLKAPEKFIVSWSDEMECPMQITTNMNLIHRLEKACILPSATFKLILPTYLQKKFTESKVSSNPFTVSKDFYKLFKALARVTHELFADAINQSGVLDYFCSKDVFDEQLGAVGNWNEVEDEVMGGVGHPPFNEKVLFNILKAAESGVTSGKPYFRAYLLPYQPETEMHRSITDVRTGGEIVAVIHPQNFGSFLKHQRDFFEDEQDLDDNLDDFATPLCIAVWINEAYRVQFPPPIDVEDCFALWSHKLFGSTECVNFQNVWRCFPNPSRCSKEMGDLFQDY